MLVYRLQGVAERLSGELHLDKFGEVSHAFVTRHLLVTRAHHLCDEGLRLFWTQGHSFVSFATGLGEGRSDILSGVPSRCQSVFEPLTGIVQELIDRVDIAAHA